MIFLDATGPVHRFFKLELLSNARAPVYIESTGRQKRKARFSNFKLTIYAEEFFARNPELDAGCSPEEL